MYKIDSGSRVQCITCGRASPGRKCQLKTSARVSRESVRDWMRCAEWYSSGATVSESEMVLRKMDVDIEIVPYSGRY